MPLSIICLQPWVYHVMLTAQYSIPVFPFTVFNTSDWMRDTSTWPKIDGVPTWPGPRDPGEAVNGQNQTECYFRGLNEPFYPYEKRVEWWHVFAARMAFVLAFQVYYSLI